MIIGSQLPELDRGVLPPPPHLICSQNTPYKLGLKLKRDVKYQVSSVDSRSFNLVLNFVK